MMDNGKQLTPKEEAFCVAYTTIGNETFNNGTKSAIEAKYAEESARTQAWRLLKKEHIKARIRELYDKNMAESMVTTSSVLANLAHDRQMARKAGQLSVAARCSELEGKYLAMFTDRIDRDEDRDTEPATPHEQAAAQAAAEAYSRVMAVGLAPEHEQNGMA